MIRVRDLIELQRRSHGPKRIRDSLGDGFLYLENPFFRRVRDAALARGFRFTAEDPGSYFGFPLTSLDLVLQKRRIPYRRSFPALVALEDSRPGFFSLADLRANRPQPNYVLHEAAHGIAFHELFGRPRNAREAMSDPDALVRVMLGEAFAMTAEYFAACAVRGTEHAWLFSINSYRRRTQKKKAIGELIDSLGFAQVAWAVLAAFLYNNFLVDRLTARQLDRIVRTRSAKRLRAALNGLMVMDPEFRRDTARLFLSAHGYPRDVERVLAEDPMDLLDRDPKARDACQRLVAILG